MTDYDEFYTEPEEEFYMPVVCWVVIWFGVALSFWLAISMFFDPN
jgi:hypothetical protein